MFCILSSRTSDPILISGLLRRATSSLFLPKSFHEGIVELLPWLSRSGVTLVSALSLLTPPISANFPSKLADELPHTGTTIALLGGAGMIINVSPETASGWRAIFWLTGGVHALVFLLVFIFYHPAPVPNPSGASYVSRLFNFDIIGTALFAASLLPLMMVRLAAQLAAWFLTSLIFAGPHLGLAFSDVLTVA